MLRKPAHHARSDYLTATDFFKYLTCPHWPWFDRFADAKDRELKRELTEGEKHRLEDGYAHEERVMEALMKGKAVKTMQETGDPATLFAATKQAMEEGAECIYQGTLLHGDWWGRPDLLIRTEGASSLGNWHYFAMDIKSSHELKNTHTAQLVFYSQLLKNIQGVFPSKAGIINLDHEEHMIDPSASLSEFADLLEKLQRVRSGERPASVVRKSCFDTGPWGEACLADAEAKNDIALLYNVDVRKLEILRGLGIKTVNDVAEMNADEYAGIAPGLTARGLETMKYQARALRDKTVFVKTPVELLESPYEIYFDIESDLPNDADYLYGFLVREDHREPEYIRFVAEKPEDESLMWKAFLAWLETLPDDYVVYHYASYEKTRLRLLAQRHGGSDALERFRSRLIDLKPPATGRITFPLYFYSLKKICRSLGFQWRGNLQSGGESIDYYERWCKTGDRKILEDILIYNEDDVRATAHLKDWLATYALSTAEYHEPYPWL